VIRNIKIQLPIRKILIASILLALFFNVGCINKEKLKATFGDGDFEVDNSSAGTMLTLEGSASVVDLLETLVEEFSNEFEIDMTIDESSVAMADVLEGNSDIAIYDNLDIEKGNSENAEILTEDSLIVIVNKGNPEDNIDSDELTDLITDQIDIFGSDTSAQLILPDENSISWSRLLSLFPLEDYSDDFELMAVSVPPSAMILGSDDEIVEQVEKESAALGVVGADANLKKVKSLTVDSFTIDDDEYPAKIQIKLLAKDPDSAFAKKVIEYIKSDSGNSILSECGFTSVE